MVHADVDRSKNLLRIIYRGRVEAEETKRYLADITAMVAELKPGFRLLTDLSGLESMEVACVTDIKRIMDACNKQGVSRVVRVIPDPHKDIGLNILSLFHYSRKVRIVTCETLAEATKVLSA